MERNSKHQKKLKIAHVITRMIVGGAQENTLLTCRALAAKPDYAVTLIAGPGLGPEGDLLTTLHPHENFTLKILPSLRREIHLWRDLVSLVQLIILFRRERYDVVHTHSSKAGILGRWAAWLTGVPIRLHTIHGWEFHDFQPRWIRRFFILLERLTVPLTHRLIGVSKENIKKGLQARIGTQKLYCTIYSGIDVLGMQTPVDVPALRLSLHIPQGKYVIGTVGRLSTQKNPLFTVHLAQCLKQKYAHVFFVMVGDGPLRAQVEQEVNCLNLKDSFCLSGLRHDASQLLKSFDLFILPSRWEGLPRTLLAAMAAGKAVVASRTDGILELIREGENGLLANPDQLEDWVCAVETLLKDPQQSAQLGKAAQKTITDRFSDVKMVKDLEALYQEECHKKGIGP